MSAPHRPTTRVMHLPSRRLGVLDHLDAAGEPVVQFFGSPTKFPFTWEVVEVVNSDEHELIPGGFELGLYVDGEGDSWREVGVGSDGETLFNLVSLGGHHVTPYHEPWTREQIVEFTGALEPAGSPAARHLREQRSDTAGGDGSATLIGCLLGMVCALGLIGLVWLVLL